MLYNKDNFAIKNFTSESENRPEIAGIFVTQKETVATDSYVLARVSVENSNIQDFPEIPNKRIPRGFSSFILPADKAGDVTKIFNKPNQNLPILDYAVISMKKDDMVEIGTTDLESYKSVMGKITEGKFPDYKQISVKKGKYNSITVNAKYLAKIASFLSSFVDQKTDVTIDFPVDPEKPLFFNAKKTTGQVAEVILMPIRTT